MLSQFQLGGFSTVLLLAFATDQFSAPIDQGRKMKENQMNRSSSNVPSFSRQNSGKFTILLTPDPYLYKQEHHTSETCLYINYQNIKGEKDTTKPQRNV